jgi:predicted phage terminase large subunit-like protein
MRNFSPLQQEAAKELLRRRTAQGGLEAYIDYLDTGFSPARHHKLLIEKLEAVERGEIKRLMVFMPPGSAKSTYGSVLFPSWYLGRNKKKSVIAASHNGELAARFGRKVRNFVGGTEFNAVFGIGLADDSKAADRWETTEGGEYFAVGVGGSVTGRRADLGLIDDPIKGREEADSETAREKVWEWYKADFFTRLKPGAAIVVIQTRWHEDDLAGKLLKDAQEGGEQWEVVSLCMEAEEDDPLGREPGELLWPEWFTPDMVAQAKRDPRNWLALYQQKPRPDGGGVFKREWVMHYDGSPADISGGTNRYLLVDPSSGKRSKSKTKNDYTSMWVVGLGQDQNYYVLEMVRDRLNLTARAQKLMELHRKWKPKQTRYEDYGMQADIEHIRDRQERENYRFDITALGGSMPKVDRIRRLIPWFEKGRIYLMPSLRKTNYEGVNIDLTQAFINEEYKAFPVAAHDDMLDALARFTDEDLPFAWPAAYAYEEDDEDDDRGRNSATGY